MPTYRVQNADGQTVLIEGPQPPSMEIVQRAFGALPQPAPAPDAGTPRLNADQRRQQAMFEAARQNVQQAPREDPARMPGLDQAATAGAPQTAGWDYGTLLNKVGEGTQQAAEAFVTPLVEVVPKIDRATMAEVMRNAAQPPPVLGGSPVGPAPQFDPESVPVAVATGAEHGAADLVNFFTSPLGIATMGMGALPVRAQQIISATFAGDMLRQVPDMALDLYAEIRKPEGERDYEKIANLTTHAMGALGFGAMAGKHAFKGPRTRQAEALARTLEGDLVRPTQAEQRPLTGPDFAEVRPGERGPVPEQYVEGMDFEMAARAEQPPALSLSRSQAESGLREGVSGEAGPTAMDRMMLSRVEEAAAPPTPPATPAAQPTPAAAAPEVTTKLPATLPKAEGERLKAEVTARAAPVSPKPAGAKLPSMERGTGSAEIAELKRQLAAEQKKLDKNVNKMGSRVPPPIVAEVSRKIATRMAKLQDKIDALEQAKPAPAPKAEVTAPAAAPVTAAEAKATLPHKYQEGQQVMAGVAPMRRPGVIAANGPWTPGQEPTYFVKTALGEVLYKESQLSQAEVTASAAAPVTAAEARAVAAEVATPPAVQQAKPFDAKAAKGQKKFLLDELEKAIEDAPQSPTPVPGDRDLLAMQSVEHWPSGETKQTFEARQAVTLDPLYEKYAVPLEDPYQNTAVPVVDRPGRLRLAIERAIGQQREKVMIEVPGDGTFELQNHRAALEAFSKRAKKFPTTAPKSGKSSQGRTEPANPAPLGPAKTPADAAKAVAVAASTDERRYVLQVVYSDGTQMVATDGRRLIRAKTKGAGTPEAPKFYNPDGTSHPIKKGEEFNYPNFNQVIPPETTVVGKDLDTARLFTVLRQAQEAATDKGAVERAVNVWRNPDGSLGFSLDSSEGAYRHNVQDAAQFITAISVDYLLDAVNTARRFGDEKVRFEVSPNVSGGPAVIRSDNVESVIMPVRNAWVDSMTAKDAARIYKSLKQGKAKPEIQGMGGAIPSEFTPSSRAPTSIKNSTVDAERAARGLPPLMSALRREWGAVWDDAMARIDAAPDAADVLMARFKANPFALTDTENAILLHRRVDLRNELAKAQRNLAQAYDDAQRFPDRLWAVEEERARATAFGDDLMALDEVLRATGTQQGRALASRNMLANEDFTLASMELQTRAAKGGAPLTDAERTQLVELQAKLAETQKRFDDYAAKADAEKATRAAQEAVTEQIRQVAKEVDPAVEAIVDRIARNLHAQAQKSRAALDEIWGRTNTGVDPTILYHLSVIGADKLVALGRNRAVEFELWAREMVSDLGDRVKPILKEAWEASNARLNVSVDKESGGRSEPVKKRIRKTDTTAQREATTKIIRQAREDKMPATEIGPAARKLAETFIRDGLHDREAIVDAVWEVLKTEFDPNMSRRQAMDAISGYGDFKPLNPDAIKAELRDIKGQLQQLAKLEDIQNRAPLLKTGVERRTPSDAERRLIQQVNEAKRRFGVVTNDTSSQLKSALDAIKTRLQHQIADLDWQISNRQKITRTRTRTEYDAEAKVLQAQRDALRQEFDQIFPKAPMSDAQRVQVAMRAVQRQIDLYETRIKAGDASPMVQARNLKSGELDALKARRTALRAEWEEMRDLVDPGRRDRLALAGYKRALTQQAARYRERLANGDFYPKPRREQRLDPEGFKLKADVELAKHEFVKGLAQHRLAQRSALRKAADTGKEVLNLPKAVWSAYDLSAVLRQGGWLAWAHPVRAARNIAPMMRALASERAAVAFEQQLAARPNAPLYDRSGLYLAPVTDYNIKLTKMEEIMMSRLAEHIPGVRASNRAFMTFLNGLRADSFDAMHTSLSRWRDTPLNQHELQLIANYINTATGRGDLGKLAGFAEGLATAFWAPRLVKSRIDLLTMQPLRRGLTEKGAWADTKQARALIAVEYARSLAGLAVILGLAGLAGATVGLDPRSTDYGKLIIGDTRVDLLAGMSQIAVLLTRLASGQTTNSRGQPRAIRERYRMDWAFGEVPNQVPYGATRAPGLVMNFARQKSTPTVGSALNILTGRTPDGKEVTLGQELARLPVPLAYRDTYKMLRNEGISHATALLLLELAGAGVQYHDPEAPR